MVKCQPLSVISKPLRRVHARTARELNRREGLSRRQVWYRFSDRQIRNERHYYTTLNYIHYNPTKHNYVQKPKDWTCSSLHCMKNILGLNGCGISGEHILYGIMERDGIGKIQVRSKAIYRLVMK